MPLPTDLTHLEASATLGRRVAALLDTEQVAPGVPCETIADELLEHRVQGFRCQPCLTVEPPRQKRRKSARHELQRHFRRAVPCLSCTSSRSAVTSARLIAFTDRLRHRSLPARSARTYLLNIRSIS